MKAGIFINEKIKAQAQDAAEKIVATLSPAGIETRVLKGPEEIEGLDFLFVLGGDGTFLSVASACARYKVKMVGVNFGNLGFLPYFDPSTLDAALEMVADGSYNLSRRVMLETTLDGERHLALNEVVLERSARPDWFSSTANIKVEIDGEKVDSYRADGVIVGTPTGSTGYSLSAGGSIVTTGLDAMILTPICSHSLKSRPIVFADSSMVTLSCTSSAPLSVIVDGKGRGSLSKGEKLEVKKSDCFLELVCGEDGFYSKLSKKMSNWSK